MARMSPADRREAIIAAALSVVTRKGLAATTVRDIAHELGCSSGLVHHYFESMDDLLAEAFERAAAADLEATREAVAEGVDALDRLRRFVLSYSRAELFAPPPITAESAAAKSATQEELAAVTAAADRSFQLWLDAWAEASRRPALGRTSRRINESWQHLFAALITEARGTGVVTCPDPDTTAWILLSLLDGLALQAVAHRGTIDRGSVIRWSAAVAERELGLAPGTLIPGP